jgi:PQQ-dependent catabolism-associated CXXCW motif protein
VIRRAVVHAICFVAFDALEAQSQDPPPEPTGYRMEDYRAPTPATLAGARVVRMAEADQLWKARAAFVDVLPNVPRPARNDLARKDVDEHSGQHLAAGNRLRHALGGIQRYLRSSLERITNGDHARWLVIYCSRAGCPGMPRSVR